MWTASQPLRFYIATILEQPLASVITSFGAEVVVEESCFYPQSGGNGNENKSPVLRIDDGTNASVEGSDNFVDGEWDCPLIGNVQSDASVACSGDQGVASCTAPSLEFDVTW